MAGLFFHSFIQCHKQRAITQQGVLPVTQQGVLPVAVVCYCRAHIPWDHVGWSGPGADGLFLTEASSCNNVKKVLI